MRSLGRGDRAELGRGFLTRWLPVLWQAPPEPPAAQQFQVTAQTTPARFLLRVIFSARRYTIPAAVLGIGWQVGEALVPVVMGIAIDRALATGDAGELALWIVVLGAVFLMLSLAYRFASQMTARAGELVQHRMRATLSRAVLHADGDGARQPDGGVVSLMTNDVARVSAVALTVYPVAEFAGIIFIAVSLLLIHWPLGLAVLVGAPAVVWLMGVLSRRLAHDSRVYQTLLAKTVGRATDLVAGYRVIKGVRAEAEAARRYREASRQTLDGAFRNVGLLGRFLVGSNTVSGIFVAAVAALAGWFAIAGELSVGGLIAAVGLAQALLAPMRMLAMNAVPAWAAAIASSSRVLDALKGSPRVTEDRPSADLSVVGVPVVGLSFEQGAAVRIEPGEMVGIRADERRAMDIVDALVNPHSRGEVQVSIDENQPPRKRLDRYRSTVLVSPHHATLFSGTIADNLALSTSSTQVRDEALRVAACDDFVEAAGGLDGQVGEMGNRLSGGQRQRLVLARALAGDAPVLVLHDPTTAVDSVTEELIASRLRGLRRNRSTLVIASSPALLNACDRIIDLRGHDDERSNENVA